MRTTMLLLAGLLALPAGAAAQAGTRAPADDAALLRRRVVQLEDRVAMLERVLERLQSERRAGAGAPVAREAAPAQVATVDEAFPSEGWRDRENWRRLRPGLSQVEVRYLLGDPQRVAVIDFDTFWYYPARHGGWVRMDREGRNVVSWAEP